MAEGHEWKHGWIPVSPAAVVSKNHGKKPGPGSKLGKGGNQSKISGAASSAAAVHGRMKAADAKRTAKPPTPSKPKPKPKAAPAKPAAKAPSRPAAKASPSSPAKTAAKPKASPKIGADSHGKPLRQGDEVAVVGEGRSGQVVGKGARGTIKIKDSNGKTSEEDPGNLRHAGDHQTDRAARQKAADTQRRETGPVSPQTITKAQSQIRDAYKQILADRVKAGITGMPTEHGRAYVKLSDLRRHLGDTFTRKEVDATLTHMISMPDVSLVPESNRKTMNAQDHAAAVTIGDQEKNLIQVGGGNTVPKPKGR